MDGIEGVEYLIASGISMAAMSFSSSKMADRSTRRKKSKKQTVVYTLFYHIYILIYKFLYIYIDYLLILVFKTMFQNHNPFRDTKPNRLTNCGKVPLRRPCCRSWTPEACAPGHMAGTPMFFFPCFGNPEVRQRFFFFKIYEVISLKTGGILGKEKDDKRSNFFVQLSETPPDLSLRSKRWPRGVKWGERMVLYMGVPKNRGKTPNWMVKIMENCKNPIKMDDLGVPLFSETPTSFLLKLQVWLIEELNFCWRKGGIGNLTFGLKF